MIYVIHAMYKILKNIKSTRRLHVGCFGVPGNQSRSTYKTI
jgi:hypothetical protein